MAAARRQGEGPCSGHILVVGRDGERFPSALRYDAFGQRTALAGPNYPTPYQFAGGWGYETEYSDATEPYLGLDYVEQRYYEPATGRFVSPDPIGFDGGLNLFAYCDNDPVNAVDPEGTCLQKSDPGCLNTPYGPLQICEMPFGTVGSFFEEALLEWPAFAQLVSRLPKIRWPSLGRLGEKIAEYRPRMLRGSVGVPGGGSKLGDSSLLARNLARAGILRPLRTAAHHIVAGDSPKGAAARAILQRFGIGINEAENGVFLPTKGSAAAGVSHPSMHTNVYYQEVERRLLGARTRAGAVQILEGIRHDLLAGTFPVR